VKPLTDRDLDVLEMALAGAHIPDDMTLFVEHGFVEKAGLGYNATLDGIAAVRAYRALKNGYTSNSMTQKFGHTVPTTRHLTADERDELRRKCHLVL
jgi:hypothetical protein